MRSIPRKAVSVAAAALCLWASSAAATPVTVGGSFTWAQVSGSGGKSADSFTFSFVSDPSELLTISRIDLTLGTGTTGVAGTLFFDLASSGAGWDSYGSSPVTTSGGASYSGSGAPLGWISDGLAAGNNDATLFFGQLSVGQGFTFGADVDHTGMNGAQKPTLLSLFGCGLSGSDCDNVSAAEFLNGGAFSYTIFFALTDPAASMAGPGSFNFGRPTFLATGASSAISNWGATLDISQPVVANPEPSTLLLLAAGLFGVGMRRRRGPSSS